MIKIYDVETAQKSILKRIPPDETEAPPAVLERIAAMFGERIGAEEAVKRILRDVRTRGDAALREWSDKLDGFPAEVTELFYRVRFGDESLDGDHLERLEQRLNLFRGAIQATGANQPAE